MRRRYKELMVDRVDLVDKGANFDAHTGDGAHIMLFKRDDTAKVALKCPACGDPLPTGWNDGPSVANYCPNCGAKIDIKAKAPATKRETTMTEPNETQHWLAILPVAVQKALGIKQPPAATTTETAAPQQTEKQQTEETTMPATVTTVNMTQAEFQKSLDDTVAKALAGATAENADLKKRLTDAEAATKKAADDVKTANDARLLEQHTTVAKSFKHVTFDVAKDAAVLMRLSEGTATKEDGARVMELFKALDAQLETASLFKAQGHDKHVVKSDSAEAEVYKRAEALVVAKSAKTREQGIAAVCEADPELYNRYTDEMAARGRRQ